MKHAKLLECIKKLSGKLRNFNIFSVSGKIGLVFVLLVVLTGVVSVLFMGNAHKIPSGGSLEGPSIIHPLGTDDLGMDILAQIAHGAFISIQVGFFSAVLAGIGGSVLGILAGYCGGWADKFIMGICDVLMVIPQLPLMIVLGAFFGPSLRNIILVIVILSWSRPARIARARVLSMCQDGYIIAAKSYGAGFWHLAARHFIPGILPILLVSVIRLISKAIRAEAGLTFLGLGDPASKSWGVILNRSINFSGIYYTNYWKWWVMSPLTVLILLVLSISFIARDMELLFRNKGEKP